MKSKSALSVLMAASVAALGVFAPVSATAVGPEDYPSMAERVAQVVAEHGGEQTGWNQVSWDGGDTVLTLAPTAGPTATIAPLAAATCTAGKYCVYSQISYGGNELAFTACPATQTSFGVIGSVRSIKNARTSSTVRAYAGTTVRATLSPGAGSANVSGVTKVTCG